MEEPKKRGFAAMTPEQRKAISAKGGKQKVPKGFALMDKEKLLKASSKGGSKKKSLQ